MVTGAGNAALTPEADAVLQEQGVFVIPDILANSGRVVVSYFEWVQDLQAFFWQEEEVSRKLHNLTTRAFYDVLPISTNSRVDMRTAAHMIAIQRVANATTVRGLYP